MAYNEPQQSLSVSAYLRLVNANLSKLGGRVKGEVTSVSPSAKAVYFKIKDKEADALLECMIWVNKYQANGITLKIGDEVILTGVPDIYAPYGKFSFRTETIEYAGEGQLKRDYERLKAQLTSEGVFDNEKKRVMPSFPKKIGILTSMSGVVIEDFTTNIGRHGFKFTAVDSRVEGKDAIHDILNSLYTLNRQDIDLLVIIRGGGSLEAMQPFNTEAVVRAVAAFNVPVITGIGHDTDVTLTQLAADIPCSTPTAVAEKINEQWDGLRDKIERLHKSILGEYRSSLYARKMTVESSQQSIYRSFERAISIARSQIQVKSSNLLSRFNEIAQRIRRVNASLLKSVGILGNNISIINSRISRSGKTISKKLRLSIDSKGKNVRTAAISALRSQQVAIKKSRDNIEANEKIINRVDPENNIRLGYSLSFVDGKLARRISDVIPGALMTTKLSNGTITSEVKGVE